MQPRRIFPFIAIVITFLIVSCSSAPKGTEYGMIIHGGAGTILKKNMSAETEQAYRDKMTEALQAGYDILNDGGASLDAVAAAIIIMEDSPLFNSGKGAVFTGEGFNELDASIMDGSDRRAGAVAGVRHVKNPIKLARLVMDESPHVMLSGAGAEIFAKDHDLEIVPAEYFFTQRRWDSLQRVKAREEEAKPHGTVGAAALDKHGNLAAGTSTGGMTNKKWGRIGDAPIIGAGTYADNKTCAISATGHGEYFIRLGVTRTIAALMELKGYTLEKASNQVIMNDLGEMGGTGGIIAIDKDGNFAMPFNTAGMYRGTIDAQGVVTIKIYKDE